MTSPLVTAQVLLRGPALNAKTSVVASTEAAPIAVVHLPLGAAIASADSTLLRALAISLVDAATALEDYQDQAIAALTR